MNAAYDIGAAARAFGMVTTVIPSTVIAALNLLAQARAWIAP
ncbi:hypothetical protein PEC18_10495 [Paucibacter sp. O1-1]|nr:hypothetical protein [Paucibacter sp. O1-1]MDA3826259.1 hypothetical protein [Paucibacter sp. O1-1]